MSSGALPGFVTRQFFASARVSGEARAAGVALAATGEEGGEVGVVASVGGAAEGLGVALELGLAGVAGEHAANSRVSSKSTAEVLMNNPDRG